MKIAITADLHWGSRSHGDESTRAMARALHEEAPDVLVLAGDLASAGLDNVRACLEQFEGLPAERLFIAGNHDIWTPDGDSEELLRETLPAVGREHGFHYLEGAPWVDPTGRVGIAGTIGWYDYSFRDRSLPYDLDQYRRKYVRRVAAYNDRLFVRWPHSDEEFTALIVDELRATLAGLSARVEEIVAVTHHLPFEELVVRWPDHPAWAFANAYLGAARLGEALLEFPRVRHHFCGHSHVGICTRRNGLRSVNVGSNYHWKRYELLEI